MNFQHTLKDLLTIQGIALHSGKTVNMTLKPSAPGSGIRFVRMDLPDAPEIDAHFKNVVNTQLATTLGIGQARVGTVEHLMAALQIFEVDNLRIEIDGPEVPILDGSAATFCEALEQIGLQSQLQARPYLQVRRRIELKIAERWAVAEPSSRLEIDETVEWDHPVIGHQRFHYSEGITPYSELASARTFGFLKDVENLKRMGLARGGSLENAVVLDEGNVLNPEGLRYPDEFVRHKVLDALGDFKLAGIPIHAHVRLHRAGHDLHSQLLAAIFQDEDNYEIIGIPLDREERRPTRIRAALARLVASV